MFLAQGTPSSCDRRNQGDKPVREYVNTNPRLNHTIQFNDFAESLGGAGLGVSDFAIRVQEDEDESQLNELGAPFGVVGLGASGFAQRGHAPKDDDKRGVFWGWR